MATIDDEQQRKGNLGGPDLFLAPIGRIDSEKISKFYCNTCERDYEGAPQIQYENPNEEVAENLILVEKGQYICSNCNSTLAEYREFKKPDDAADIGTAKSLTPQREPEPEPYSPPPPSITMPDFNIQDLPTPPTPQEEITSESTQVASSFNSIAGMEVFDENARKIGTVKQVGVDRGQNVVLVITKTDESETAIKWSEIKKIGEIILLGKGGPEPSPQTAQTFTTPQATFSPPKTAPSQTTTPPPPPTQQTTPPPQPATPPPSTTPKCPNCGFSNKPGSKFCESCGSKL